MPTDIGEVEAIFRYPVKSMAGERLESAALGWHGLEGDRRFAVRRLEDRGEFPWLTAGTLADLVLFAPRRAAGGAGDGPPTHVRTPEGVELPIFGEELAAEIGRRHGAPVQVMHWKHGVFDEAPVSVIASETMREVGRLAGRDADERRFRPNVVVRLLQPGAFREDAWVGGVLAFGEGDAAARLAVTQRDVRCSMVTIDPETAARDPEVQKAVVRANGNTAGIYGTVIRTGRLAVGQRIFLHASDEWAHLLESDPPTAVVLHWKRRDRQHERATAGQLSEANRQLTEQERRLIRWMLEHGDPQAAGFLPQLDDAEATPDKCPCGCASLYLQIRGRPEAPPGVHVIADFVFGDDRTLSGIFVYESNGILSGLEVYGLAGDAPASLPQPEELRPWAAGLPASGDN